MRRNKFLAALAIAACLATSVPFSASAATPTVSYKPASITSTTRAALLTLFKADHYKAQNPDLATAGITTNDALFNHFVNYGIFEGRSCNPDFDVNAYMSSYTDLQKAFGSDIIAYYLHYLSYGKTEKRELTTIAKATAAGVTVKSIVDGHVISSGTVYVAPSSGEPAFDVSGAEEAVLKSGVFYLADENIFVDSNDTKALIAGKVVDESKYVEVGGKYYAIVSPETDTDKYALSVSANDGDHNTVSAWYEKSAGKEYDDVFVVGVNADNYVNVGGKYYWIYKGSVESVLKSGYAFDGSSKKAYDLNAADSTKLTPVLDVYARVGADGLYYDTFGADVSCNEITTKEGSKVYVTTAGLTAAEAYFAYLIEFTVADGYVFVADSTNETVNAYKAVALADALVDNYGATANGDIYWAADAYTELEATSKYMKPEYVYIPETGKYHVALEVTDTYKAEFASTKVGSSTVYYNKNNALTLENVQEDGYVAPEGYADFGGTAYKLLTIDTAFVEKDGYKVVKQTVNGVARFFYIAE